MKYHNIPTLFDNQASLINGKNIGTDSVRYIQDAGQKTAGTTYIDKNTNELYVCVTTTNSVNNDSNFSKFNLKEAFNKLDSLKDKKSLTIPSWGREDKYVAYYINGNVGYNQILIVWSHDNLPPYLIMILVGGNNRDSPWSFNYRIIYKDSNIVIKGGTYLQPFIITTTSKNLDGYLTLTALGDYCINDNLNVKYELID